jgi:rifampicin phosphotransferase
MSATTTANRSSQQAAVTDGHLVVPLSRAVEETAVGGKARALARLIALDVPVPDGVVVTCAGLERFLEHSGLRSLIDQEPDSDGIRSLIVAAPVPRDLNEQLRAAVQTLGSGPFAVRSSAVGEDGRNTSFAGQFDSILHVNEESLLDAVRACWASCWSARALAYRRAHCVATASMAVIVQRQVDAAVAGVLFTQNPDRNSPHAADMVVEYTSGLADRLVSGEIDPGRLYVSRRFLAVTGEVATAEDANARQMLTPSLVHELSATALQLEETFNGPQDIEWAVAAEGLAIVQARPITTVTPDFRLKAEATESDQNLGQERVLWSNANVAENFPEPISPLLYSIASAGYYHYFRNLGRAFGVSRTRLASMDGPLRTIIGVHRARVYYNLTNIHAVLRMAPFGERLADAFNVFVGAERIADQPAGMHSWRDARRRAGATLEALRIAMAVTWQFLFLPHRLRAFERTADEFAARTTTEALRERRLHELGADLAAFIDIRCHRWKNASLCDTAAAVCYAVLRSLLARGGFDDSTHTRLLRALPGVPSSQPALRLWRLSRLIVDDPALRTLFAESSAATVLASLESDSRFSAFHAEFTQFLATWGFRSSGELMLTTPTLEEQSEPVVALLKQYITAEGDSPEESIARMAVERTAETRMVARALMRRRPWLLLPVLLWLRWTQAAVAARERARLKQALLYTRCRRVALAIGDALVARRQLSDRDGIFMLSWHEIDEVCNGRAMFPRDLSTLVELRRQAHVAESADNPPDSFELAPAGVLPDSVPPSLLPRRNNSRLATASVALRGTTACGGRVSARAAVLAGVHEAHLLQRGDVLVTRQTDPGWAPVFCLVSGLVIERGGMLSHGAIIAREFGLPCIVGVANATQQIPHGAMLSVNADDGVCEIGAVA